MNSYLSEWLNLALRWFHLVAGISWIGSSFYFMWLDKALEAPAKPREGVEGELWMVHSGGFYQVEKRLIGPGSMPSVLHWFKWEATFTWLSGITLLAVVYYLSDSAYLINPAKTSIGHGTASAIGIGVLAATWILYDLLWKSRFAKEHSTFALAICYAATAAISWGLSQIFTGRGAFIHVGAMFGTIMVLNVWVRILPAQQSMIDATREGRTPDYNLGKAAKTRSVHNSYMTLPVLFIMISNHFPSTYSGPWSWVILLGMTFVGGAIRHMQIIAKPRVAWLALPVIAVLSAIIVTAAPKKASGDGSPPPKFSEAWGIIQTRCTTCHSQNPTDDVFTVAPAGMMFDDPRTAQAFAARIKFRAVDSHTMPFGNKTNITEEERQILGRWVDAGAPITDN
ncbi:MAG: hypothetical protein RIQ81_2659 [Pseudomonadota bacterium]|jgi:uncharacterized membrane protein